MISTLQLVVYTTLAHKQYCWPFCSSFLAFHTDVCSMLYHLLVWCFVLFSMPNLLGYLVKLSTISISVIHPMQIYQIRLACSWWLDWLSFNVQDFLFLKVSAWCMFHSACMQCERTPIFRTWALVFQTMWGKFTLEFLKSWECHILN